MIRYKDIIRIKKFIFSEQQPAGHTCHNTGWKIIYKEEEEKEKKGKEDISKGFILEKNAMPWKLKIETFKKWIKRTFGFSPRKINTDEVNNTEMCNIIANRKNGPAV